MLRGFRHTLFLLLQIGVILSGLVALAIQPQSWLAILICVTGGLVASYACERMARRYLRYTFGRLRRAAEDVSLGGPMPAIAARPGDDFYKLVTYVNQVAAQLAKASKEEKRLNIELRERERLAFLGELAASVAHEINNPLDGVQSCVRILRRAPGDTQRAAQMLDLIDSGLGRMNLIVRRLLTLAREHVVRPLPASIGAIVARSVIAERARIDERGINVTVESEAADDHAAVDAQLLEQVFVNLIHNAVDSMPAGGELALRIWREAGVTGSDERGAGSQDAICVGVADTGSGIDPEVRPHIFEPFFTTKTGGKGTGLGLPIAARIVDAHHGAIRVAARQGGGSIFTVWIPCSTDSAPSAVVRDAAIAKPPAAAGPLAPLDVVTATDGALR